MSLNIKPITTKINNFVSPIENDTNITINNKINDPKTLSCHAIIKRNRKEKDDLLSKRILFDQPNSKNLDEWLQKIKEKFIYDKVKKWKFDFDSNKPLPCTSLIKYEVLDEKEVPTFYRTVVKGKTKTKKENLSQFVSTKNQKTKDTAMNVKTKNNACNENILINKSPYKIKSPEKNRKNTNQSPRKTSVVTRMASAALISPLKNNEKNSFTAELSPEPEIQKSVLNVTLASPRKEWNVCFATNPSDNNFHKNSFEFLNSFFPSKQLNYENKEHKTPLKKN